VDSEGWRRSVGRLSALVRKEFVQLRRDKRSLALVVAMPAVLMLIFGYAASFDVKHLGIELVGHDSQVVRSVLAASGHFDVHAAVVGDAAQATSDLRHGRVVVAVEVGASGRPVGLLVDGSRLLEATSAERELAGLIGGGQTTHLPVEMLWNPDLRSADFMVPGLIGVIMAQVGMVLTSLGIVRERERGTLDQLMMTPLSRLELMLGKIFPYLLIAFVDLVMVSGLGIGLFHVPFRGNPVLLLALSALFLASTLGIGLLISTVAQNQQQAVQTAIFVLLPQVLLSGWIFPLTSIPWGVRWLSYLMPLTYFLPISRGIFLKGLGVPDLWPDIAVLLAMAIVVVGLASARFRRSLA
jgi:ABC-2 type transport system permease protein